jgi:hypothetical protein
MTESTNGRTLVLVAGSGRSGTSLLSGILQRLGFSVPQPEVPADATNPRGFAESQWVVDFHAKLLSGAGVQTADARPSAWADTAAAALDPETLRTLRTWLERQFATSDAVLIKDPRLSWFLPLWRRCAQDVGADPRFVTMLRHPAAVIDSKQKWYGGSQGEAGRLAGWVNQTLFTERATRESPRVFVHYESLLEDWTQTVSRVGAELDLAVVRDAPATAIRDVHGFVDRSLSRSRPEWSEAPLPATLRAQADEIWELVSRLAQDGVTPPDAAAIGARLDAIRADYLDVYTEAEAIAQSSIAAAARTSRADAVRAGGRRPGGLPAPALWVIRRTPTRLRKALPDRYRHGVVRALRSGAGAR